MCTGLTSTVTPDSVTSIDKAALDGCHAALDIGGAASFGPNETIVQQSARRYSYTSAMAAYTASHLSITVLAALDLQLLAALLLINVSTLDGSVELPKVRWCRVL